MSTPITVVGRLTADAETTTTPSGSTALNMRIVTKRRRKHDDGTWGDADVTGWTVTAFGVLAERAAHFRKGDNIIAVGQAVEHAWTNKQGEPRSRIEVHATALGPDYRWMEPDGHTPPF